ncbi:MAG: helix-hairpin-helix domain-containing protein, partial [Anaerolineae bacterium]
TGCKVALVDPTGKVLDTVTIYPHPPQKQWAAAKSILEGAVEREDVDVIAVGNGTASRETEQLVAELISEHPAIEYAMVSEAGASVYSASKLARQELPGMDVSMRGAVSIARRLQDPLAELVKIDPQSIGVGMYQHDVDQKMLSEALDAVVESTVNYVGVDVNTASPALLGYVAGLSSRVAANVVAYRDEHGPFQKRSELKKVKGLGPKSYEQAAGFLRVPESSNPLDNSPIHPESYAVVRRLLELAGTRLKARDMRGRVQQARQEVGLSGLAELLEVGEPTLADILDGLARPGRDPRDDLPAPILRQDVLTMEDLRTGMRLKGTVRNVVDFGAFVDIGVKQDGLVHVSKMADRYVRNPFDVVSVGDVVDVTVISVDLERGRIGLSMRD